MLIGMATVFIAGSFLVAEKLADIINPFSLALLRFVGAALILLPVIAVNPLFRKKILPTMPRAMVIGLFYSIFFICLFESLKTTTSLNTATLYTLVPFTTGVLCIFVFGQKLPGKSLSAYFLGVVGTVWVIFNGDIDLLLALSLNKGDYIFMAGAFSMCCYTISMKVLYRNDDMVVLVFCILVGGSFWMAVAILSTGLPLQWHLIEGKSLFHMAYLIIFATLATVYLFQKSTIALGPSKVMAYIYLNPVLVALLVFIFEGRLVPLMVVPGILFSTLATIVLQRSPSP